MKQFPLLSPLVSVAAAIGLCVAPPARAAVDTVTTTADTGPGSLRDTIAAANSGDTILFSALLAGQTIYLTSGELYIGQNLTIDASALSGGIAIDGGAINRVMEIGGGAVTIDALTLTNGYVSEDDGAGALVDDAASLIAINCVFCGNGAGEYGGAISSYGALTLNDCTISDNSAAIFGGGIFASQGGASINGGTFIGNSSQVGGGIENELGALTLNNCLFSNNVSSDFGGGIDCEDEGALALTNCVFVGNSSGTAGALSAETSAMLCQCVFSNNISTNNAGGGIVNYDTMMLNNCTLSGNRVNTGGDGGGLINSGTLTMKQCAIFNNSAINGYGAGMYNGGILTLDNCTVSGNCATNGMGAGFYCRSQSTNTLINCTICGNSAAGGSGGGIESHAINSSAISVLLTNTVVANNAATVGAEIDGYYSGAANFIGGNPELSSPGDYGGPTPTMPPLHGSPVIDAGADWVTNFLATDQRGCPRLAGAHVDIGAVEAREFMVLNANDDGNGSLRATLTNSPDFVTFTNTLGGQTIHLTTGELRVTNPLTIDASALAGGIAIDAGKNSRVLEISDGNVILNGLTLTNGYVWGNEMGGGILVDPGCALIASNCAVSDNFAGLGGGGIECGGTVIALSHCIVLGNSATGLGGGIDCATGAATLSNCTLCGNSADEGGAIYSPSALTLANCVVISNNVAGDGGGISGAGVLTLNNSAFTGNSAMEAGGAIECPDLDWNDLAATNCTFTANSATGGGALDGINGTLDQCSISNNVAQYGAGILTEDDVTLNTCTLAANTATNGEGGAISSGDQLTANNCVFSNNTGTNAGAIYNSFDMTLNDCTLLGNSAGGGDGGAIYNYGTMSLNNCNLSGNSATNAQGGGIFNWWLLTLNGCSFSGDVAAGGGAVANGGGTANGIALTANNCSLFDNAATYGGAIFNAVTMTLNNCTLAENIAGAGAGFGGAICNQSVESIYGFYPTNFLINCTIYGNSALAAGGGLYSDSSSTVTLTNTIVAQNSAGADSDIYGAYSGAANFIGGNPRLAGLGNYGGGTLTAPPEFGSPVIDTGADWVTNFLATDQRGYPRLSGKHVDIGAVEAQSAPINNRPLLRIAAVIFIGSGDISFRFSFTNAPDADFTVLTSTNLAIPPDQWTIAGNVPKGPLGQFQYIQPFPGSNPGELTNYPSQQFFRVVSP